MLADFENFTIRNSLFVNAQCLHRLEACATRFPILFLFNKTGFYQVIYKAILFFLKFFVVPDYPSHNFHPATPLAAQCFTGKQ